MGKNVTSWRFSAFCIRISKIDLFLYVSSDSSIVQSRGCDRKHFYQIAGCVPGWSLLSHQKGSFIVFVEAEWLQPGDKSVPSMLKGPLLSEFDEFHLLIFAAVTLFSQIL